MKKNYSHDKHEPHAEPESRISGGDTLHQADFGLDCAQKECPLAEAMASMGEAMAIWDADDKLLACNELYRQLFSEPDEVAPGVSFMDLVEQNIRQGNVISFQGLKDVRRDLNRYRRERRDYHRHCRGVFQVQIWDRSWSQASERKTPRGGVVGVYTDITDRKRFEHELDLAKQKEEQANLAKSRFLAAASHDLRQPLHALGLFASSLEPLLETGEQKVLMAQMQSCLKSLEGLFSSLLDVSRLDAGVVLPVQTGFRLDEVLTPLVEEFRPLAAEKGLVIHQAPCRGWVSGDSSLLGRVVRNLLSNAVKYTEKGKILVGLRRSGSRFRLEVWDTGPGIAKSDQEQIFEEFSRLPSASKLGAAGLGLGLSIARRLTELAGWRLGVISCPGKGSCFYLSLPRSLPPKAQPATPAAPAAISLKGKRIICLEDDPEVQKGLQAILRRWGCAPLPHRSLEDLEKSWNSGGPDPHLVISDFHLEGEANGLMALERIARLLGRPLPGLILTGDTTPQCLQAVKASGHHLLHKPVSPMRLRAVLEACLV